MKSTERLPCAEFYWSPRSSGKSYECYPVHHTSCEDLCCRALGEYHQSRTRHHRCLQVRASPLRQHYSQHDRMHLAQ
eukprot:6471629-Amphidinium_carterae.2